MARLLQLAGLSVGLVALILQFALTVPASMAAGRSLGGSIVFYFSFFTILSNIAAVMVHASLISPGGYAWFPAFAAPRVRTGAAREAMAGAAAPGPSGSAARTCSAPTLQRCPSGPRWPSGSTGHANGNWSRATASRTWRAARGSSRCRRTPH